MITFTVQAIETDTAGATSDNYLFKDFSWPVLPRIGENIDVDEDSDIQPVQEVSHFLCTEDASAKPTVVVYIETKDFAALQMKSKWRQTP